MEDPIFKLISETTDSNGDWLLTFETTPEILAFLQSYYGTPDFGEQLIKDAMALAQKGDIFNGTKNN